MKKAALTMALLAGCASAQENPNSGVAPAGSETAVPAASSDTGPPASSETAPPPASSDAGPAPTISDSSPSSPAPMPPSRLNVVPPVSPDKPLADAVGTAPDSSKSFEATPATAADLAKGVAVNDPSGQPVGTIDSTTDSAIVLKIGERRIQVPRNTVGKNEKGLVIGVTKADLEAAADKAPKQ